MWALRYPVIVALMTSLVGPAGAANSSCEIPLKSCMCTPPPVVRMCTRPVANPSCPTELPICELGHLESSKSN
jgi:hypothetical protein